MKDRYVGTIVGNYEILECMPNRDKYGHHIYKVRCIKCGYVAYKKIVQLRKYNLTDECHHFVVRVHWYSDRLKTIFHSMKQRCYDVNDKDYRFYGRKHIIICDEWLNNPQLFNDWALDNGYSDEFTIDRIDPYKNYCPENCRWITMKQNAKWKSITNRITVNGITDSGRGWANRLGVGVNTINRWKRENGEEYCIKRIKELI